MSHGQCLKPITILNRIQLTYLLSLQKYLTCTEILELIEILVIEL